MPIEHLGLIPWWQVSRMVMHRATTRARDAAPAALATERSR
jgi:hypothetical protein